VKLKLIDGVGQVIQDGPFDLIVDSQGGDDLPARVNALFALLRYQGLYIAEHVESCALQSKDPNTPGAHGSQSCAGWWRHLVGMLNRPVGAGRTTTAQCEKTRGCDLQIESLHVWKGVVALRKGSVHPYWDQKLSLWFPPHPFAKADLMDHRPFQAADHRDDGCWRHRRQFLRLCEQRYADKGVLHGYWRGYGVLLERFRRVRGLRVAELGLSQGKSLRLWADFFSNDAIFHMSDTTSTNFDAVRRSLDRQVQGRVHMHSANLTIGKGAWMHPEFDWNGTVRGIASMRGEAEKSGGFHLIVDDAGHSPLQNLMFFHELIGVVLPGGYYVCEDLGAGGFGTIARREMTRPTLPQAIRRTPTPIGMFVNVTRTIAGKGSDSVCGGCDAGLVSAHWWLETVLFERGA